MENNKIVSLVGLSVLLGLVSGFVSEYVSLKSLIFVLPGLFLGVSICIMLKFVLKVKQSTKQYLLFIVLSLVAYYMSLISGSISLYMSFMLENVPFEILSYINDLIASLVGAIGICLSFAIFKFQFKRENIIVIIVSVLVTLLTLLVMPEEIFTNRGALIQTTLWQGAIMGCLAYFILKKIQKENYIQINQVNSTTTSSM
jgi:hypothetical protein